MKIDKFRSLKKEIALEKKTALSLGILIVYLFALTLIFTNESTPTGYVTTDEGIIACSDSDNGLDYYTEGIVTTDTIHPDSCSGNTLTEYYCPDVSLAEYIAITFACPTSCSNNKCSLATGKTPLLVQSFTGFEIKIDSSETSAYIYLRDLDNNILVSDSIDNLRTNSASLSASTSKPTKIILAGLSSGTKAGDSVTLKKLNSGSDIAITFPRTTSDTVFYIANDGSTYYDSSLTQLAYQSQPVSSSTETGSTNQNSGSSGGSPGGSGSPSSSTAGAGSSTLSFELSSKTLSVTKNKVYTFSYGLNSHKLTILDTTPTTVKVKIESTPKEYTLTKGIEQQVDLNNDGTSEISLTVTEISGLTAKISYKALQTSTYTPPQTINTNQQDPQPNTNLDNSNTNFGDYPYGSTSSETPILIIILTIILIIIGLALTAFWIWMIVDCAKRKFDKKVMWLLLIIILGIIPAIIYFFIIKRKKKSMPLPPQPKNPQTASSQSKPS